MDSTAASALSPLRPVQVVFWEPFPSCVQLPSSVTRLRGETTVDTVKAANTPPSVVQHRVLRGSPAMKLELLLR